VKAVAAGEAGFFAVSDAYERFMGRWSRRLAPMFASFADVRDARAVLDVGSGTGALTRAVAGAAPSASVVGVDPSAAYVAQAQAQTPDSRVRFVIGDAQALEFGDASFDRVVSLLALNFVPDPVRAVREMMRVTRPGGIVAVAVWDYPDRMQMLRAFWDAAVARDPAAAMRDERRMRFARQGELAALWREHGLSAVDEQPLTIETTFTSFDDYWLPFLGGQGPAGAYAMSLPEADRDALRTALLRQLADGDPTRPITLEARAWAVRGVVPCPSP
jgi:ubiquinone/menaquinone biosynthesis C-methylase UbiE